MTASTSSTLRPTTAGTLVAGFPRGRFYASPGTRVLSFSRASSTTSPADALRGFGPRGVREGAGDVAAGRIERSARPLPVAGAGLDQAAQRLVCGAAPRAVLDGHLIARQADRAVDVADRTGPASSRTPYPTAEQAGPQVLRAPVAAALSSPPPDPLPGLAAALRGLTHEAARIPQLHSASSSSMIRYQTDDEGVVSQPEYTLTKPSNGPNDRDHLRGRGRVVTDKCVECLFYALDSVNPARPAHSRYGPFRSDSPRSCLAGFEPAPCRSTGRVYPAVRQQGVRAQVTTSCHLPDRVVGADGHSSSFSGSGQEIRVLG